MGTSSDDAGQPSAVGGNGDKHPSSTSSGKPRKERTSKCAYCGMVSIISGSLVSTHPTFDHNYSSRNVDVHELEAIAGFI
jgi:hypothetical protein